MPTATTPMSQPETLSVIWHFDNSYGALTEPLLLAGDQLVGVSGGTMFANDLYYGNPVAQGFPYTLQSEMGGSPHVTAAGGQLYFMDGTDGNSLVALRLATGQALPGWVAPSIEQVVSLLAVENQVVVVHTAVNSGATMVSVYQGGSGARVFGPITISEQSPGAVAYGHGAVFFVAAGVLKGVNIDFGDTRWQFTPAAPATALDLSVAPLVTDALVLVATADALLAVDQTRGQALWSVPRSGTGPVKWATPALDDTGRLAIATNSGGDIFGISLADGSLVWHTTAPAPGVPRVIADRVYITTNGGSTLAVYNCVDGTPVISYLLPNQTAEAPPVIGNGTIIIPSATGSIDAQSFATQDAAYFDGTSSRINIMPDDGQFDFGLDDFTVEAWFKTSVGGEIVSGYPTAGQADDHGFRLNLTSAGEFRVAVVNDSLVVLNVGKTAPTTAADGEWHHVAFMRRSGTFVVLLDGQSMTVLLPSTTSARNSIGGHNGLTIGAYVGTPAGTPGDYFYGLIREVRIWNRALDVAAVETNLKVELTGNEPRLLGLWRLDEYQPHDSPTEPRNAVSRHSSTAEFVNPKSVPTDLAMDKSAFPYLLHESTPRWPYAGTWAARGESPVATTPAISTDGIIAFGTNNTLYGVRKMDGKRAWSLDTPTGLSAPVADGTSFWVLTGEESLLSLNSANGKKQQIPGFAGLTDGHNGILAAPAVSTDYIAAGSSSGLVYIAPRHAAPTVQPTKVTGGPGPVRHLEFIPGAARLLCVAGPAASPKLLVLDAATGIALASPINLISPVYCLTASSILCVQSDGLKRLNALQPGAALAITTTIDPASITGMAAWPDADLLVVTTQNGYAYGLSLAKLHTLWTRNLAGLATGPAVVNTPTFDDAGRVFCTTSSGVLAVLDPNTGSILGVVLEPQAITTPALVEAGTAYFGCADTTDPKADCDGALHSFVLGQTMALRLGLDEFGQPSATANSYAVIDAETSDATLHLMDVTQSCIEAWVNIPPAAAGSGRAVAGGVLSICPTDAADAFDLKLSIDPDGTIHYAARSHEAAGWTSLQAQAPSVVCDGKWHHVAVSRQGESQLVIYLDGQALPFSTPPTSTSGPAPAQTVTGLKAYLGATFDDSLAAAQPFCGMIGEVRVWDTYLESTEIAARMHIKLRGDEPDILAYWNFDHEAVHDSARQGHDGVLTQPITSPMWWLTDLSFALPSYPHFVTTAQLRQEGNTTGTGTDAETVYDLTITVQKADNTGLGNQALNLWYVRHDESEPQTVTINGTTITGILHGTAEPEPAPAGTAGAPVYCYTTTSLPNGKVTVSVATSLTGHGPSIDVRAPFMPLNERFHVNCLIDNQALAKPVPPALTAQTCLIQDYHYSPGNQIDETRNRSTHRVVLTAANADHSVRANEAVTLWASADMQIEVAGQSYTINANNSSDFTTTSHGELVVVIEASDFSTPTLYARAGFMHRNDQMVISPDEDAQKQLTTLTDTRLTTPTLGNWKKDHTDTDKQTILNSDYTPHAADIAQSVRHVMSTVKPAAPTPAPTAAAGSTALGLGSAAGSTAFADMRQPLMPPRADRATVLRTTAGILRKPPVNPDALRASLNGNLGFVFACDRKDPTSFRFQHLATQAEVDLERGTPTAPALGSWFSSAWDSIEDAAEDVYAEAQKIVVSITNTINIAIHSLEGIVHIVVDSIEKAVNAVVNFFKQLALALELLLLLLRALLDWGGIRDSAQLIQQMLESIGEQIASPTFKKPITDGITSLFDSVESWLGLDTSSLSGTTSADYREDTDTSVQESANGVPAKMMFHKFQDNVGDMISSALSAVGSDLSTMPYVKKIVPDLVNGIVPIFSDLATMDFHDVATNLEALIRTLAQDSLDFAKQWSLALVEHLFTSFKDMLTDSGSAVIDIPVLSALYKWITGNDLTMRDVSCFLIGFPVHVVYYVATRGSRFSDDASGWFPTAGSTALGLEGGPDDKSREIGYTVVKSVNILAVVLTDASFSRSGDSLPRSIAKVFRGLSGIAATYLAFFFTTKQYSELLDNAIIASGGKPTDNSTNREILNYGALGVATLADTITLGGGLNGVKNAVSAAWKSRNQVVPDQGGQPQIGGNDVEPGNADKAELFITLSNAVVSIALIGKQINSMVNDTEYKNGFNNDAMKKASLLMGSRRIFFLTPKLMGWMFTQTGAGDLLKNPYVKGGVTATRAVVNVAGLAMHCTAAFNYLDL